jgi:uncharacterized protein YdhG (YjbR/CyaY superfamily)
MTDKITNIDEYIQNYPENVQKILQGMRETIQKAVPEATETMSYGMPTFDLNGHHLVYFSAWKDHIGLYPLYADGPLAAEKAFTAFKQEKNSIHFPFTEPFPYDVVEKFARMRITEESPKHTK